MFGPYTADTKEFTIDPGCPWYEAQQTFGAPNVNWCEPTQCSLINEPANAWSNLGYILIGIWLIQKCKNTPVVAFGMIVLLTGSFSFVYHATNNFMTQLLDFIGMFLILSFLISFAFHRVFGRLKVHFYSLFWFCMFLNSWVFLIFDIINAPVQNIILFNALIIVFLEIWAGWGRNQLKQYKWFYLAFVSLIVAQVFASADLMRSYCEPQNLFLHGHVLWHLFGALGMAFVGLHIQKMHRLVPGP